MIENQRMERELPYKSKYLCMLILILVLLNIPLCFAEEPPAPARLGLFITGLSGSHQFKTYFDQAPGKIRETLTANGYQPEDFTWFSEKGEHQNWVDEQIARKENLLTYLGRQAGQSKAYDEVFIFIAGHANGRDEEAMMHLPGDDISYDALMKGIDAIPAKRMLIVVAAPQGDIWIKKLAKPGRVIIAANGYRQYDFIPMIFLRIFPSIFEQAGQADPSGETKHVSLLDIFTDTQKRVQRWYQRNNLHCTELALIDADGDGKGESLFTSEALPDLPQKKENAMPEAAAFAMNLDLPDARMAKAIFYTAQGGKSS